MRTFPRIKGQEKDRALPSVFRPSMVNPSELAKPYLFPSSSSPLRKELPLLITFDDWGKGGVFDWYRKQPVTSIRKVDLRKKRDTVGHEFVVIHLGNGRVYRVDRRPIADTNLKTICCEAQDSISPLNEEEYKAMDFDTDSQIVLEFGSHRPDLYAIIATCVSIQMDPESKPYTLQKYNCFFLARTIVTLLVRHHIRQLPRSQDVLRWDTINRSAISKYMFGEDWRMLDEAIKRAVSTRLYDALWPLVKAEADIRLEKKRELDKLEALATNAIREAVAKSVESLVVDSVKDAACHWIIGSTQETVWHANLAHSLLTEKYFSVYEQEVEHVVKQTLQPELSRNLPDQMVAKVADILPQRLINRLPDRLVANIPVELLARVPVNVLERLPDDLLAKISPDILSISPDEFLQKIPPELFVRLPSSVTFNPPEDLGRLPDRILQIVLRRMCEALDKPPEHEDRALALKLLLRLPENILGDLPTRYRDLREETMENDSKRSTEAAVPEMAQQTSSTGISSEDTPYASNRTIRERWKRFSILGLLIHLAPTPILEHLPRVLLEAMPLAAIRSVPADALAILPPGYLSKLSVEYMTKLPQELLEKLPETLLHKLPRATLERVPDSLLDRFPIEIMRNIPPAFLENLSEDLIDLLRKALTPEMFESNDLGAELTRHVGGIVEAKLINSKGDLSETDVRIAARSKFGYMENVRTHEVMQARILAMIRQHSKAVAKVAHFGVGEEVVFNGLRDKMEAIWRMMRLHAVPITA